MYPHAEGLGEITGEMLFRKKYGGLAGVRTPVNSTGGSSLLNTEHSYYVRRRNNDQR